MYRKIGGHSFPWVYSGPIGAIITPQFMGVTHEPGLPFASSLCGACAEVCPVKIDIPQVLLDLRSDVKKAETREKQNRLEKFAFRMFAWLMTHPRIYAMAGRIGAARCRFRRSARCARGSASATCRRCRRRASAICGGER